MDQRPEDNCGDVQIGDNANVISGPYRGFVGTVELISSSTVYLRTVAPAFPHIAVPVTSAIFLPPSNALRYSAEKGYNVRSGDAVEVVRGHRMGRRGIVREIDFQKKILEVNAWANSICISPLFPSPTNLFTRNVFSC